METFVCILMAVGVVATFMVMGKVTGGFTGHARPEIVCPHCQTAGQVRITLVRRKQGVSGGKATGAILTGGASLLGTGLSRHQWVSQARCGHCRMVWTIE